MLSAFGAFVTFMISLRRIQMFLLTYLLLLEQVIAARGTSQRGPTRKQFDF